MKKSILVLTMCLLAFCGAMAQEHYATCKIIEDKGKVRFEFSPETRYLGNEYEKTIIYFDKKKLSFTDGNEAVSYLSESFGWVLCGNPTQLKGGSIMWIMRHEIDRNIVNFTRNVRAFEEGQRRYRNNQDDIYYKGK